MSTPKPIFDAAGIPLDGVDEFWKGLVRELFTNLNEQGWDMPSALYALMTPAASEAAFYAETGLTPDILSDEHHSDRDAPSLYQFTLVRESFDHPRNWLPLLPIPLVLERWRSLRKPGSRR